MGVQGNQEAPGHGQPGASWRRALLVAGGESELPLGGRPTGRWETAVVVAVYSTRPSRWCQAPAATRSAYSVRRAIRRVLTAAGHDVRVRFVPPGGPSGLRITGKQIEVRPGRAC